MTFIEKRSAYDTIGYVEVLPLYMYNIVCFFSINSV